MTGSLSKILYNFPNDIHQKKDKDNNIQQKVRKPKEKQKKNAGTVLTTKEMAQENIKPDNMALYML